MFVAVVPPEEVLAELEEFLEPRREAGGPLRWTVREQWHLTLAFLPQVAERHLDELGERLTRAAARRTSFQLQLMGAGTFPNPARAKVLWTGLSGGTEELSRLATGARAAAARTGVVVEGAGFRPHVTLARMSRAQEATRWLRVFEAYAGRTWSVTEVALIESHLGEGPRGRPRYETVEVFAMGAGGGP